MPRGYNLCEKKEKRKHAHSDRPAEGRRQVAKAEPGPPCPATQNRTGPWTGGEGSWDRLQAGIKRALLRSSGATLGSSASVSPLGASTAHPLSPRLAGYQVSADPTVSSSVTGFPRGLYAPGGTYIVSWKPHNSPKKGPPFASEFLGLKVRLKEVK